MHVGHFFIHNFYPTKTCGILCIALQVIKGFLLSMMVQILIIVIPKSCDVLSTITIQLMLMLSMFPMEKIKAFYVITKTMGHHIWKNMYIMNMWKNATSKTYYWCKKLKEMDLNKTQQRKGKIFLLIWSLSFLATIGLITKLTLCNMHFLKT